MWAHLEAPDIPPDSHEPHCKEQAAVWCPLGLPGSSQNLPWTSPLPCSLGSACFSFRIQLSHDYQRLGISTVASSRWKPRGKFLPWPFSNHHKELTQSSQPP